MIDRHQTLADDARQSDLVGSTLYCDRCHRIQRTGAEGGAHDCGFPGHGTLFEFRPDAAVFNDGLSRDDAYRKADPYPLVRVLMRRGSRSGHYWLRCWGYTDDDGVLWAMRRNRQGRVRLYYTRVEQWGFHVEF